MSAVLELRVSSGLSWLRRLSEDLASAQDERAIGQAAVRWLPAALPGVEMGLWRRDGSGRLRPIPGGQGERLATWVRPDERWALLEAGRATVVRSSAEGDRSHAVLPLSSRGAPVGVFELLAGTRDIEATWELLEVVAAQIGMALAVARPPERPRRNGRKRRGAAVSADGGAPATNGNGPGKDLDLTVAWVAHELRGPLAAVRAALELLSERQGSVTGENLLAQCIVELRQMSRLVDDILRWGIVGEAPPPRRSDVVRVVRESLERCRRELGEDRFSLVAPGPAFALVDPVQLGGAISNLLRNAAAYSPADGVVEVTVEADREKIAVSVRDSGPGIPPHEHEAIFHPFVRGSSAGAHFGKGLGLFIARRVAEATGGRLLLVAEGSTEFRLELPRDGDA